MIEIKRSDSVQSERALLVGVLLPKSSADPSDPLGELRSLVKTAGAEVIDEMVCKREKPTPGLYVGTGKAEEIARRAEVNQADVVIFDNDLAPGQIRDLEGIIRRKVLDRSQVILDIFAAHARTHESRVQVELAQLEYTYPRLVHMWSHLERVAGGASTAAAAVGGIGTRGPGERQLEIDRRLVQKRVSMLKRRIDEVDRRKVREVKSRRDEFCVCLVGYTNAGKSTLMNLLTGADTYVADKLFATLETKTRRWRLDNGSDVLLSDTVGFVRDLPHHLVASFRATLEEAIWADLLIHVADASHERVEHQIKAVQDVLTELGVDQSRTMLVLNKTDAIADPMTRLILSRQHPEAVMLSAATGEGAAALSQAVAERSGGGKVRLTLEANCRNGKLMTYIARHAEISRQDYADATARIEAIMTTRQADLLETFGRDVQVLERSSV